MAETLPRVRGKVSAWDRITLDTDTIGEQNAGSETGIKIRISGTPGKRNIEVQKSDGEDAGTLVDKGLDPAKPIIEIEAHPDQQDFVWSVLQKHDPTRDGFVATPIPVIYPSLNACGIRDIVITELHFPENLPSGWVRYKATCIRYSEKPKPKTLGGAGTGSGASGSTAAAEAAEDAADAIGSAFTSAGNVIRKTATRAGQWLGIIERPSVPGQISNAAGGLISGLGSFFS